MPSMTRHTDRPGPLAAALLALAALTRADRRKPQRGAAGPVPTIDTRPLADGYHRAARRRRDAIERKAAKHARANQHQSTARTYTRGAGIRHGHAPRHVNRGPRGIAARARMAEIRRHRNPAPTRRGAA